MSAPVVSSTIAPGRAGAAARGDEPDVIAVGDEADLLGVGLVGVGQPGPPRQRAHLVLAHVAERKPDARQQLGADAEEEVRLVLAAVAGPAEHDAAVVGGRQPGVVPGRERRRADGVGERQQRPELELLVAAHARVRRLTRRGSRRRSRRSPTRETPRSRRSRGGRCRDARPSRARPRCRAARSSARRCWRPCRSRRRAAASRR